MTHPLDELAARVEKAEGPDRALDAAIVLAIGWTAPQQQGSCGVFYARRELYDWHDEKGVARGFYPPRLTASLDAARTLVDEYGMSLLGPMMGSGLWQATCGEDGEHQSDARTPELALVAASLRARAAVGEG